MGSGNNSGKKVGVSEADNNHISGESEYEDCKFPLRAFHIQLPKKVAFH